MLMNSMLAAWFFSWQAPPERIVVKVCADDLFPTPIGSDSIIVVYAPVILAIPVPPGACRILRRTFDLFLGQIGSVALKTCVMSCAATFFFGGNRPKQF